MKQKFTNCIYVGSHPIAYIWEGNQANKIGSSKVLPGRIRSYKTYYPTEMKLQGYFYIDGYDCYQLDDDIKIDFSHQRIKSTGGIEFYTGISLDDLSHYFISRGIKYTLYQDDDYKEMDPIELNDLILQGYQEEADNNIRGYKFFLQNQMLNYEIVKTNVNLKKWQEELVESFDKFVHSNETTGIIIAPTGCGKSFMIRYLSLFVWISKFKSDILIMTKRKEIFDQTFIDQTNQMIFDHKLNIQVINLIDSEFDSNIFNSETSQTSKSNIYIINNDKFIASPKYSNYTSYSWGKIKLLVLDESHWSGANKFNDFLKYMKDNIVDKIIGLSATPVRTSESNKQKTLDIFKSMTNPLDYNIIYQRSFLESIDQGDRVPNQWLIIPINSDGFDQDEKDDELTDKHEFDESYVNPKYKFKLSSKGIEIFIKWLDQWIINSIKSKGILWFGSKAGLKEFYSWIETNKSSYSNLQSINFLPTYSKTLANETDTSKSINHFKKLESNGILLAVMRAIEGFDDPTIDFGFNVYLCDSSDPLLDQQKEGRVCRNFTNKTVGYYGFVVNTLGLSYEKNIVCRLGSWLKYVNEFTSYEFTQHKKNLICSKCKQKFNTHSDLQTHLTLCDEEPLYKYMDILINSNQIQQINLDQIKTKIQLYADSIGINSSIGQIKSHIQKINKYRQSNYLELIDTEKKYIQYAIINNLPTNLSIPSDNWVKFTRSDYSKLVSESLDENQYIKLIDGKFISIEQLEKYLETNEIKPTYSQVSNGFYNKNFNFIKYLISEIHEII